MSMETISNSRLLHAKLYLNGVCYDDAPSKHIIFLNVLSFLVFRSSAKTPWWPSDLIYNPSGLWVQNPDRTAEFLEIYVRNYICNIPRPFSMTTY